MSSPRREFLAFLDRLAEGKGTREDWARFAVTHHREADIEAERVRLVRVAVQEDGWSWPNMPEPVRAAARAIRKAMQAAETPIATTTAIPVAALEAVRAAASRKRTLLGIEKDEFPVVLARHGRALEVFEHPGTALAAVLGSLAGKGVDLGHSRHDEVAAGISKARGSRFVILAEEHLPLAVELTDAAVSREDLAAFVDAGEGFDAGAMLEGIRFLRRALEAVTPGTVVLVAIL